MKTATKALTAMLVLAGWAQLAQAEEVRCESINNGQAECAINTDGEIHLVRQLSKADCDEGRTWGVGHGEIWVTGGCRAIFESSAESSSDSGGTTSSLPNRVTCESVNDGRTECEMDTRGEVRLVSRQSDAACDYGVSWGANKHTIWVDHGCRATFESDGTGPVYENDPAYGGQAPSVPENAGGVPSELVAACNAVDDDYGKVVSSTPLKPGHWEVILDYNKGRYVCNVGPGGEVTYFERLRNQ